jgi:hypothetical protein
MKTQLLLVLIAVLVSKLSFGDIILSNTHYVAKCVKITNVEDYPDVAFIGYSFWGDMGVSATELSSSECLNKGYKFNGFAVYAVNKGDLKGKDINKINYPTDPNTFPSNIAIEPYRGYVHDNIPISGIEEYYKVMGFSDTNVILFKWKQVTKYNNGKPDLTETFTYDGEVSQLYQKIAVGTNFSKQPSAIEVYPNPANKNVHLRITNNYSGTVSVELITSTGKVAKAFQINKLTSILDHEFSDSNVAKGACFVKVQMGKEVEYKKIVMQ